MNEIIWFFVGFFTALFALILFWFFATLNSGVASTYRSTIGYQVCDVANDT